VLGKCGGTTSDISDAIRWAAGLPVPDVPANSNPAKVISLSLGGRGACSQSPSTQAAIDDAVAQGATVVVAAGNDAADAAGYTPAGCDNVITVAASDLRGHLVERYSNFGDTVDIMAPGGDLQRDDNGDGIEDGVLSTIQGGYALYNGTSMAAPHVSGVVALMLAEEPTLTPQEVLARLQETALPRSDTECAQPCGAGLLQAAKGEVPPPRLALTVDPASVDLEPGKTASVEASVTRDGSPAPGIELQLASQDDNVVKVTPGSATTDDAGRVSATLEAMAPGGPVCVDVGANGEEACVRVTVVAAPTPTPGRSVWGLATLIAFMLVWVGWRYRGTASQHGTSA
jgi:serine protease